MRKLTSLSVGGLLFASAPAWADEPYAVTPSGNTEAIFDLPLQQASDRMANACLDQGWTMIESSSTMVVCEPPMNFGQSLLASLAIGNQYSTPPRTFYRFNLAGLGGSTRVQVSAWVETQMAFGQVRRMELATDKYHNSAMGFFRNVGARYPAGTSYPNHAYAGFESLSLPVQSPEDGLRIVQIVQGSATEEAGLQVGDVVTRVSRERVKNQFDLMDGMRKAIKSLTYEVEFYRGRAKQKVTLERRHRAVEVAPDPSTLLAAQVAASPAIQAIMPLSVADELSKFAKLHQDGVLSDEEFNAQKARLLGSRVQGAPAAQQPPNEATDAPNTVKSRILQPDASGVVRIGGGS